MINIILTMDELITNQLHFFFFNILKPRSVYF